MLIIVGASASGKTEIAKLLVKDYNFTKCITTTTRKIRINEKKGVDYHFLSKPEFLDLIKNNLLVEYTIYQDNYYGVQKKDIKDNSLIILEPNGANNLIKLYGKKVFVIFIKSKKEKRISRMENRGDCYKSIQARIKNDDKLFNEKNLLRIDKTIINENKSLASLAKEINELYKKHNEI